MPVRNEAAFIQRSLNAVLAQDYPRDRMEVIVADGLSTDGTRDIVNVLRRQNQHLYLIDNPGQIVSTGLNAALRLAKGEIIVRVDGHCEIAADYVSRCVLHLTEYKVDCVGGPLETIGDTFSARAIAAAMSSGFGVGASAFRTGTREAKLVDTVAFPGILRETIQRVGPFDEELVRNQDDEYSYRLRKLGGQILLSPDIQARYYSRASFRKLWKQYFQYGYWKVRVLQKHSGQMSARQFVPPLFVMTLLLLILSAPFFVLSRWLLLGVISSYAVLNLGAAITAALKTGWRFFPLFPLSFTIIHLAYGCGFLVGILKFWNRWGDHTTRSMQPGLQEHIGLS